MQAQANWENQLLALAGNLQYPDRPLLSYSSGDASLGRAYAQAERITKAHSKSFHFASSLLPEAKRMAVRALYAFCRTVDDIVDESDAEYDRQSALSYWRYMVEHASFADGDLVATAWADTLSRYHIPRHYARQLIDGVARDFEQTRYETFQDLATYCYGVASTVGLMSMYIVDFKTHEAVPYAIKLGVALQMTNILRDVGEDYRQGRLYLPREELVYFGIREEDIALGRRSDNWRQFMRFQIDRTRQLYADSWEGVRLLEREGQLAIGAASVFYQGILNEIEKNHYDVFTRRASLSAMGKVGKIPTLWLKVKSL